jgi:hypothetical protein
MTHGVQLDHFRVDNNNALGRTPQLHGSGRKHVLLWMFQVNGSRAHLLRLGMPRLVERTRRFPLGLEQLEHCLGLEQLAEEGGVRNTSRRL